MELKSKITAKIVENTMLSEDVFSMWIEVGKIAKTTLPGQFVSLYTRDGSRLLPRPISICEIDRENEKLRLVYRVVGEGTAEFARLVPDLDNIEIVGSLGKGFPMDKVGNSVLLFGGGIGIPPLLEAAKELKSRRKMATVILGYRTNDTFLVEDFEKYAEVIIATDDGSLGCKGTVIDAANELEAAEKYGVTDIFSCGPMPMLRGVKEYGESRNIPTYISLEERMACGIGVCLGCVCESKEVDHHSNVTNKRVCKDGPVFLSTEVII